MAKFIFLIFISAGVVLHAQTPDCKKWRNGIFVTYPSIGEANYIVRKGSKQTEYNSITKTKEEFILRWLDLCTYVLYRTMRTSKKNGLHPGIIYTVSILDTYEKHCLVFVSSNLPGDVGHFDCMYLGPDPKKFLIAP